MDIRSLQLFQHLAISLHFGKTSAALFVSPSTLSRCIQRLEQESGAKLFVRDNRSVKLTQAGEKMLSFSQKVLADWQQLKSDLDQSQQILQAELSIYCSVTASQSHLPQLLDNFRHHYPGVEIKLLTGDPGIAVDKVLEQQADLAIAIHTPDFPAQLEFQLMDQMALQLITPKHSQISKLSQLDWRIHPVVLPEAGPTKRIVHHWFAEHGIRPKIYASVAGSEAIVSMVALGCGVGFVPKVVMDHSTLEHKVNRFDVTDIEPFHLGLCCLRERANEAAIKAFFERINIDR